jgi:hypothetical protein
MRCARSIATAGNARFRGADITYRSRHVCWGLYEAAQVMLMHSVKWSWLKAWAMKIARLRGRKKAIVALARRLAVIVHRI